MNKKTLLTILGVTALVFVFRKMKGKSVANTPSRNEEPTSEQNQVQADIQFAKKESGFKAQFEQGVKNAKYLIERSSSYSQLTPKMIQRLNDFYTLIESDEEMQKQIFKTAKYRNTTVDRIIRNWASKYVTFGSDLAVGSPSNWNTNKNEIFFGFTIDNFEV